MIKSALTHDYERMAHDRILTDFLKAYYAITPQDTEQVKIEKGDIPKKGGNGNGTDSERQGR